MSEPKDRQQHLHAIGIGGIGVSALARHYLKMGWSVSGCDLASHVSVEGVHVLVGHDAGHIDAYTPTMVVYSPACPVDHPELLRAQEKHIPIFSYPEALGLFSRDYNTIAVSGTHGKSTTTALLTQMFAEGGKDPIAIVGARVPAEGFEENYRHGKGKDFIVEGCEYKRGMLQLRPKSAMITNIEADHLDYYKDLSDVADAFASYARLLPMGGVLVYNADDEEAVKVSHLTNARTVSFGLHAGDLQAKDICTTPDGTSAQVSFQGDSLGKIETPLSGEFNVMNILSAMAMALSYKIPFADIQRAVKAFKGIGRRFEHIGAYMGTSVYSDYAHHPTALRVCSEASEAKFGKGNTLIVFQPHQIDRTKKLRKEFEETFRNIPHLFLPEIYIVAGREHAGEFSVKELADSVNVEKEEAVSYFSSLESLTPRVKEVAQRYKAIIFVGAGDIDRYARELLASQQI